MGHRHETPGLGVTTGSLWLQILVVAAALLVAVVVLVRPFRGALGPQAELAATVAAAAAVPVYLLLADGLAVPRQSVPLLLAAAALPVLATAGRRRAAPAMVRAVRRSAPPVMTLAGVAATLMFVRAWSADGRDGGHLHTGLILALVAVSWSALCRPGSGPRAAYVNAVAGTVAAALLAATVHADALATAA